MRNLLDLFCENSESTKTNRRVCGRPLNATTLPSSSSSVRPSLLLLATHSTTTTTLFTLQLISLLLISSVTGASAADAAATQEELTVLSAGEVHLFKSAFLTKLGMTDAPPSARRPIVVPDHLLTLYRRLQSRLPVRQQTRQKDAFDEASAFYPDEAASTSIQSTSANQAEAALIFSLDGLNADTPLESAELRFAVTDTSGDGTAEPASKLRLSVFELVRNHTVLVNSKLIDCRDFDRRLSTVERSVVVDVSASVERWRRRRRHAAEQQSSDNVAIRGGFLVRVGRTSNATCGLDLRLRPLTSHSPVLITYTGASRILTDDDDGGSRRRSKRAARRRVVTLAGERDHCRRHRMDVDFEAVGWKDWIVAPHRYSAYYCAGKCRYPLSSHSNATNHAIVQALVHSVNAHAVPEACCVPTQLGGLNLLYMDEYDKVRLKNYHQMQVLTCGCR